MVLKRSMEMKMYMENVGKCWGFFNKQEGQDGPDSSPELLRGQANFFFF